MKKPANIHKLDIAFLAALLLKVFSGGIAYFYVLDDYLQYGSYPLFDLSYVYFHIGTVSARPLASLLDPALWGQFWGHMWIALLLITVLYFLTCLMLDRLLIQNRIKVTPVLYAVCFLLPITFEGTYWISASSRIVVGMFFAVLCAQLLMEILQTKKKPLIPVYVLCCLASFGFYESVLIFSGLLQLFVAVSYTVKKKSVKSLGYLAVPVVCAVLFLLYYTFGANFGILGSRASGFSLTGMGERLKMFFSQFAYIFTAGMFRTTVNGLIDGIRRMVASPVWGSALFILITAISLLCALTGKKHKLRANAKICIPLGLALIFLPLLPHLLVPDVWLTYRSIAVTLPGFCVLFAPLAAWILKNRYVRILVVFILVFVCSVGCVNEVQTYKEVNALDRLLLARLIPHLDEQVLAGEKEVILVLPHEIAVPQTSYYKDHVKSFFYADWGITGAVCAVTENPNIKTITPVYTLEDTDIHGKQILYMDASYHITEEEPHE